MKFYLFISITFTMVLCCNAVYNTSKTYENPLKKGSKSCLLQCSYMKDNCSNRCKSKQKYGCIIDDTSENDPFQILYKDKCYIKKINCTRSCSGELLCIQICDNNWYTCQKEINKDLDCSDRCVKTCQSKYDDCFIKCGGIIY